MKRASTLIALLVIASSLVGPAPRGAVQLGVTPAAVRPLTAERHLGAPHNSGPSRESTHLTADIGGAPTPSGEVGTALIGGWASWYDDPRKDGRYAAAGPLLREALGNWRGKTIRVTSGNRATLVVLSDFCACGERHGVPTIIDLSPHAFADLAPLAQGLVRVEIEIVALPATDTPDQSVCDPPEHEADRRMRLEDR